MDRDANSGREPISARGAVLGNANLMASEELVRIPILDNEPLDLSVRSSRQGSGLSSKEAAEESVKESTFD